MDAPRSYPEVLTPFVTELPARDAQWLGKVRYSRPTFESWPAGKSRPLDTKGGKPLLCVDDQPCFGELAILRAFEADGWQARWIDNYPLPPTFRTSYWDTEWNKLSRDRANSPLPADIRRVYDGICAEAGDPKGAGAWDVIAWRGSEMAFVEAKKLGSSDRIKPGQLAWLEAAIRRGVKRDSLLFVEWSARDP
jgi:hypothetical protein